MSLAGSLLLSVLDLSPVSSGMPASAALHETIELARVAEAAGYHRYWLAEHHNVPSVTCSTPEVMIAAVAAATTRIRVGSGGVMLPNHSPLKVAETFRVLAGLYPGRIDLGIGRASGTDPLTALALRRSRDRDALDVDDFPEQYDELVSYVDGFAAGHPLATVTAMPDDVPLPPVWILGSRRYGAQAAAFFGTAFVYAGHFGTEDPAEVFEMYRSRFQPSSRAGSYGAGPRAMLAVAAICAETAERAEQLAVADDLASLWRRAGRPSPLPSPEEAVAYPWTAAEREAARRRRHLVTVGTPHEVRDGLLARARAAGTGELLITTAVHDPKERQRSYQLLAEAFGR